MHPGLNQDGSLKKLTPKQKAFVENYRETGSALTAYKAAGYRWERDGKPMKYLQQRAYQVLRAGSVSMALTGLVERQVRETEARKQWAIEHIVEKHMFLMDLALSKGDLTVATRNLELIGKTRGAYIEGVAINITHEREFSDREQRDARRLGALLLLDDDEQGVIEHHPAPEEATAPAQEARDNDDRRQGLGNGAEGGRDGLGAEPDQDGDDVSHGRGNAALAVEEADLQQPGPALPASQAQPEPVTVTAPGRHLISILKRRKRTQT